LEIGDLKLENQEWKLETGNSKIASRKNPDTTFQIYPRHGFRRPLLNLVTTPVAERSGPS
jgi:hypothetical protein